jgi:hypothetical protein
MDSASPSSGRSVQVFNIIIIALVMMLTLRFASLNQYNLAPIVGCDNFGYARQAELFRENGWIRGLDTSITAPQAQLLISLAKEALPNNRSWYEAVAPHCHHYNRRTDKIILQYPPGAGMIFSLFPESRAVRHMLIAGTALTTLVLCWMLIGRKLNALAVLATCSAFVFLFWILSDNQAYLSPSIPITLLLIPASAWLARAFPDGSYLTAIFFGLTCGILTSIRLPNAIILAGLVVQTVIAAKLWNRLNLATHRKNIVLAILGLLVGLLPVLISNHINAGSVFHTTYGRADASAPVFGYDLIADTLTYYFTAPLGSSALIAAFCFIGLGLVAWANDTNRKAAAGTLGATFVLLISLGFFTTHPIHVSYYMMPASVMAIFMVTVELIDRGESMNRKWQWIALLPIFIWAAHTHARVKPDAMSVKAPTEVMNPSSIVWADVTSGTFYYYSNRYAAKLNFADPVTQDVLVDSVSKAKHDQYFIVDSPQMKSACDRQASRHGVVYAGEATAFGPIPIWKLADGDPAASRTCSK